MFRQFVSLVLALNLFACICASPPENDTKLNSKSDTDSSGKSNIDSKYKDDRNRYSAPLTDLEYARTHFGALKPTLQNILPFNFGYQHQSTGHPLLSKLQILKPFFRPQVPQVAPVAPIAPIAPVAPVAPISIPSKPWFFPQPTPIFSKPHQPIVSKPTFVVSQQVIHKPLVTEKIEIIRRPVISEVVEVVHKPILSEVQQVIKHPTYVEHVVKKPVVTAIKNEVQGPAVHLPSQHYEVHEKPHHIPSVTNEVIQIPHQQAPIGASGGISSSYGYDAGYKPSYSFSSPGVTPSYGTISNFVGTQSSYGPYSPPSYGPVSGMVGPGSNYGPGYNLASWVSNGLASLFGPSSQLHPGSESAYYPIKPTYSEESGGIEHTYVEPAVSCKSDGCRLITTEEEIGENFQPMYAPLPIASALSWYDGPSHLMEGRDLYQRTNPEDYEQNLPLSPSYFYLAPQVQPYEQNSEELQDLKIANFLNHPSMKPELEALYEKYRKTTANTRTDDRKSQGRSVDEDDGTKMNMGDEKSLRGTVISEEDKLKQVMDTLNTASGSLLKKIEDGVKSRQHGIENTILKSENVSSSPNSTQTQTMNSSTS